MGLKLHEDWGSTPAAIDNCLAVAEQYDIQVYSILFIHFFMGKESIAFCDNLCFSSINSTKLNRLISTPTH